ncbi:uncharacterized protein LOC130367518 [Hyla sarda]|uniref:uncharacterized protein LOC130367518 n=1 Tax=Hyla sarda TaxID=327740 RepID=UPI0024C38A7D|nr:uncharacterized protein LOC130367518 [Hyla sarda]
MVSKASRSFCIETKGSHVTNVPNSLTTESTSGGSKEQCINPYTSIIPQHLSRQLAPPLLLSAIRSKSHRFVHKSVETWILAGDPERGNKTQDAIIPITPSSSGAARCPALSAPSGGSFHVFAAAERSLGSVALFSCQDGFQLLGHYKLKCQKKGDGLQWSHQEPQCQAISLTSHKGFRLAVIISLVSCFIIITMFVAFTVCCVREKLLQGETAAAVGGRSDPRPAFSMEIPENSSGGHGFPPNSLKESNLYRSVTFKGPNGFENSGFQA